TGDEVRVSADARSAKTQKVAAKFRFACFHVLLGSAHVLVHDGANSRFVFIVERCQQAHLVVQSGLAQRRVGLVVDATADGKVAQQVLQEAADEAEHAVGTKVGEHRM